jgi:hypothetical protein
MVKILLQTFQIPKTEVWVFLYMFNNVRHTPYKVVKEGWNNFYPKPLKSLFKKFEKIISKPCPDSFSSIVIQ